MALTAKQIEKGNRHLESARETLHMELKNLVDFKKFCKGKFFIGNTDVETIAEIKDSINEARERVARLERKYK